MAKPTVESGRQRYGWVVVSSDTLAQPGPTLGARSDATACPHDMRLTLQVPGAFTLTRLARTTAALVALGVPSLAVAQREGGDIGTAKPFAAFSNSAMSLRDSIVAVARAQIGTPYRLGGTTPGRELD